MLDAVVGTGSEDILLLYKSVRHEIIAHSIPAIGIYIHGRLVIDTLGFDTIKKTSQNLYIEFPPVLKSSSLCLFSFSCHTLSKLVLKFLLLCSWLSLKAIVTVCIYFDQGSLFIGYV